MSNIYEVGSGFRRFWQPRKSARIGGALLWKMNTVEAKMYLGWICHKAEQYAVMVVYYA